MGILKSIAAAAVKTLDHVTHSATTRWAINHFVMKRYGTMTQLHIDPKTKSIDLQLELLGETSPIHVHIDHYTFEKPPHADGAAILTVNGITVSRPWMQELAKNLLDSKPQPIPAHLAGYHAKVL
jgi:hypothetical protein